MSTEKEIWSFRLFLAMICWFAVAIFGEMFVETTTLVIILSVGWLGIFWVLWKWGTAKDEVQEQH